MGERRRGMAARSSVLWHWGGRASSVRRDTSNRGCSPPSVCVLVPPGMCTYAPRLCECPVKYERAGVKPAIDRGKRRVKEKECESDGTSRKGRGFQPHLSRQLQESALSTLQSSYVFLPPIVSLFDFPSSILSTLHDER